MRSTSLYVDAAPQQNLPVFFSLFSVLDHRGALRFNVIRIFWGQFPIVYQGPSLGDDLEACLFVLLYNCLSERICLCVEKIFLCSALVAVNYQLCVFAFAFRPPRQSTGIS